jgi:hypothetical protein
MKTWLVRYLWLWIGILAMILVLGLIIVSLFRSIGVLIIATKSGYQSEIVVHIEKGQFRVRKILVVVPPYVPDRKTYYLLSEGAAVWEPAGPRLGNSRANGFNAYVFGFRNGVTMSHGDPTASYWVVGVHCGLFLIPIVVVLFKGIRRDYFRKRGFPVLVPSKTGH